MTAVLPGGRRLVREVHAGSSYLSSEDPRVHFGLGSRDDGPRADRALPGGRVARLRDVAADRLVVVKRIAGRSRSTARPRRDVLTEDALAFLTGARARVPHRARASCSRRGTRGPQRLREGELPDFLPETADVRAGDWRVAPVPAELQDRRVEITGPVDRKMVINALNSGAKMFMADFEDSNSPTWQNCVEGQLNLTDALERTITLDTGREAVPR